MGSLWLDVRYALRMMMKAPRLTAVLAITLSLGIVTSAALRALFRHDWLLDIRELDSVLQRAVALTPMV